MDEVPAQAMICRALKLAFIHIPRTGGHTIDRLFLDNGLVSDQLWHSTAHDLIDSLGQAAYDQLFSFTIVRNPWERWLSEYLWQAGSGEHQIPTAWGNKTITFEEFCLSHHEWYRDEEIADGHLEDQSHFIYDAGDRLLVKHVLRFEQMPWRALPKRNSTQHGHYREYYTDETAELIGKRFERDVNLLKYSY